MGPRTGSREEADPWTVALRLLTRRDYGSGELRRRLRDRGFPAEAVEQALARAATLGYLDDQRYVENLTRTLLAAGRAAGPRLVLELRRRQLPEELIRAAVAASREGGKEDQALRDLVARRFPAFDLASADERDQRRVIAFLQRRGFSLDRILNELKRTDP